MSSEKYPLSEAERYELEKFRKWLLLDPENFEQLVPFQRDHMQELMLRDWLHNRRKVDQRIIKGRTLKALRQAS